MQHDKDDFLYVVKRKKTLNYKLSCIAQETGWYLNKDKLKWGNSCYVCRHSQLNKENQ